MSTVKNISNPSSKSKAMSLLCHMRHHTRSWGSRDRIGRDSKPCSAKWGGGYLSLSRHPQVSHEKSLLLSILRVGEWRDPYTGLFKPPSPQFPDPRSHLPFALPSALRASSPHRGLDEALIRSLLDALRTRPQGQANHPSLAKAGGPSFNNEESLITVITPQKTNIQK